MKHTDEAAALEGTDQGDSFATEVAGLRPWLKARAVVLLQSEAAADDLVQDTLERALLSQHLFRRGTNLRAWAASIMRNLFIDGWRRTALHLNVDTDDLVSETDAPVRVGPIDVLGMEDVLAAAAGLSPREREMFELAHIHHTGYREIAERFHLRINTVGTCLFRARAKIRKALERSFARKVASAAAAAAAAEEAAGGET
jgi:RNA polymerase sigma-70 factor (ECF subfamily)